MNKISNIISLPVISIYEGNLLGYIHNVIFDYKLKKCKYACIFNENENIMNAISFDNIYSIGKDCLFIKNNSVLELKENCDNEFFNGKNPINFKIYTLQGECLGEVTDIEIDKNYNIKSILLNNGQVIKHSAIINIGNTILVSNNKFQLSKFQPNTLKNYHTKETLANKVSILKTPIVETHSQNKIITDVKFLLGRILTKDILTINGEIIARKGTQINKNIINKASLYGKLIEISRYSNA